MDRPTLIEELYSLTSFSQEDETIEAMIHLNKEHAVFKGHFPGNPVMPGVCMIQIIKELTERAVDTELFLKRSSNIKFMSIINPDIHPDLRLSIQMDRAGESVKIKAEASTSESKALKLSGEFVVVK